MDIAEAPSRPLNMFRKPKPALAHAIYDRLDRIQEVVEQHEAERRKRDRASAERFRDCLRGLCIDLFDAYLTDPHLLVGVRRDNNAFRRDNPALPAYATARTFRAALDGLEKAGYVEEVSLGNEASGKSTRVRGTIKLAQQLNIGHLKRDSLIDTSDVIILRVGPKDRKRRLGFAETPDTQRWRHNLNLINKHFSKYTIALEIDHDLQRHMEHVRLQAARSKARAEGSHFRYQKVDTRSTRLHRVFNSADWTEGGRFYGAWWQSIPKQFRQHILINGKHTCEHDYSAIHLRILYQLAGKPMPRVGDPHAEPYGEEHRNAVKRAFNVMLNARNWPRPETVPEFDEAKLGMSWKQFLGGIREHHRPIKNHLMSGIGTKLQRLDADIAEAVMLKFMEMDYPCLPIHDSFITYQTLTDELPGIMQQVAKECGNVVIPAKLVYAAQYNGPIGPVDADITDILKSITRE